MNNMKICNYVICCITAIIGIIIMSSAKELSIDFTVNGPGAGFWPFLLGGAFLFVAIVLLIRTIMIHKELEQKTITLNAPANMRVYCMMGLTVLFCIALNVLGFYLSTLLFIPAIMYLLEVRDKKTIILSTGVIVLAIYLIFGMLLNTTFPKPMFL